MSIVDLVEATKLANPTPERLQIIQLESRISKLEAELAARKADPEPTREIVARIFKLMDFVESHTYGVRLNDIATGLADGYPGILDVLDEVSRRHSAPWRKLYRDLEMLTELRPITVVNPRTSQATYILTSQAWRLGE